MANNPLEEEQLQEKKGGGTKLSPNLSDLVQREVKRILKREQSKRVNFAHITNFAGNLCLNTDSSMIRDCWIIDTMTTCHICVVYELFKDVKDLKETINIYMPDGNIRTTNKCGSIFLNEFLVLKNVLYVPSFRFNLLSIGKVLQNGNLGCNFYGNFCNFQDLKTLIK